MCFLCVTDHLAAFALLGISPRASNNHRKRTHHDLTMALTMIHCRRVGGVVRVRGRHAAAAPEDRPRGAAQLPLRAASRHRAQLSCGCVQQWCLPSDYSDFSKHTQFYLFLHCITWFGVSTSHSRTRILMHAHEFMHSRSRPHQLKLKGPMRTRIKASAHSHTVPSHTRSTPYAHCLPTLAQLPTAVV